MSQVFSADSVNFSGPITLPTSGETVAGQGNFLNPPFQNAKAVIWANVTIVLGTGTTGVQLLIRRNPAAENFLVIASFMLNATAGQTVNFSLVGADVIPDGRAVKYAVTLNTAGATGTGTINGGNISALLISG